MIRLRIALIALAIASGVGCIRIAQHDDDNRIIGSGVAKSEDRKVDPFAKVELAGSADVTIAVGGPLQVSVRTDDNILPTVETKVSGDTLVISNTKSYRSQLGVKVTIAVPELSAISISGSGNIDVTGIHNDSFRVSISGSGDIKVMDISADLFDVEISGSGNVQASGTIQKLDAVISGSGNLRLTELAAKAAAVVVSGSGNAAVNASKDLSVSIPGSGNVTYHGSPKLETSVAGSGSVSQAALAEAPL